MSEWVDGQIDGYKQICLARRVSEFQAGNLSIEELEEEES